LRLSRSLNGDFLRFIIIVSPSEDIEARHSPGFESIPFFRSVKRDMENSDCFGDAEIVPIMSPGAREQSSDSTTRIL